MLEREKALEPDPANAATVMMVQHSVDEDFRVYPHAGFRLRWYALTLDVMFSTPLEVMCHLPFERYLERLLAYGQTGTYFVLSLFLTAFPIAVYLVAPTLLTGRTLGKSIVGIRVLTDGRDRRLGFARVLIRETVGKLLSLASLGLGFLLALRAPEHKALHDQLAGTVVISYREGAG